MKIALGLASRGLGCVWPNPAVGCVVVKDGRIIGRGWTQPGGRPHAETVALAQAEKNAAGATAYVTLEPCAHHGKTPPCASALVDAAVARVVVALKDPDPRVDGGGIAMLEAAGIQVDVGCLAAQAADLNRGFLNKVVAQRPFVTLKLASSFDGRIATASGESQWITGPEARRHVHAMRATHDAVMVGGGTARADDPSLTVRGFGEVRQPVRVVVSRGLDIPLNSVLARTAMQWPVWICTSDDAPAELRDAWSSAGARLFDISTDADTQLDPTKIMTALAQQGLTRVFCEGGGALAGSVLAADQVDEIVGFTAGTVLGADGVSSIGAMGIDRLAAAPRFKLKSVQRVGDDIMHIWTR